MRVRYARVSTTDQSPELQLDALRRAGCEKIHTEKASGAKADRPELPRVLDDVLRKGACCPYQGRDCQDNGGHHDPGGCEPCRRRPRRDL